MASSAAVRKFLAHILPASLRKFVPRSVSKHLYFYGTFPVYLHGKKILTLQANGYVLENDVFFYGIEGGHEKRAMKVWIDFCETFKPREVFDIGANTGIYGLVAKTLVPTSQVSFFEPLAKAVEILTQNLKLNHFDAPIFTVALSNYDGEGHFYMSNVSDFAYSVTLNTYADLAIGGIHHEDDTLMKISTPVARVSSLLEDQKLSKPNLVKLDVETHENEVLEGFGFDLAEVDAYLIEVLNVEAANKLNKLFEGLGFHYYNLDDHHDFVQKTEKIYSTENYNYFIVKPDLALRMRTLK